MKVEYVNPFIESVYELFTTMLSAKATRRKAALSEGAGGGSEVTALIGWSGPARGTIALALPEETALSLAARLLSTEMKEVDETVMDAVSELVNIIAGGAKAKFSQSQGIGTIDLSLPTVIAGQYDVEYPSQTTWIEVPFDSDLGSFSLRVAFESVGSSSN